MRGTSWGAVWRYVKRHRPNEPRQAVLDALAEIIGVLPDCLLGSGPRTAAEAVAQQQGAQAPPSPAVDMSEEASSRFAERTEEMINEKFPAGLGWHGPGPAARSQLWRLWAEMRESLMTAARAGGTASSHLDVEAISDETMDIVRRAVMAPLEVLDALPPRRAGDGRMQAVSPRSALARIFGERLENYLILVCQALIPVVRQQAASWWEEDDYERYLREAGNAEE